MRENSTVPWRSTVAIYLVEQVAGRELHAVRG